MNGNSKLLSMYETDRLVSTAFDRWYYGQLPDVPFGEDVDLPYCWCVEVYEGFIIVCMGTGVYYQVTYTMSAEGVSFGEQSTWTRVEKDWTPVKTAETLVYSGDTVKSLGDGKVGGYLVRFGGRDLMNEYFTAKTYFGAKNGDGVDTLFHHGIVIKEGLEYLTDHIFAPLKTTVDDIGIFAETVLNMHDEYEAAILDLADKGKLGWSSGAVGSGVRRTKDGEITRWIIGEGSLTPTPAEVRNKAVPLKSIRLSDEALEMFKSFPLSSAKAKPPVTAPEAAPAASSGGGETITKGQGTSITITNSDVVINQDGATTVSQEQKTNGEFAMPPEAETKQTPATPPVQDPNARIDALTGDIKGLSDQFTNLLELLQKTPKGEGITYTNVGGGADPQVKSFGDFALSIYRKDEKRLTTVYKAQKAIAEDQGASGGYYVPPDFSTQLVAAQNAISPIIDLVARYPVQGSAGEWPILDIFTAPTAGSGNTAFAAQLIASVIAEAGTFTDRNVKFQILNWRVSKIGDIVKVSQEMMEDAPALDALLRQLMTVALASRKERSIIRGTGVGEPLGFLNAGALITQSPASAGTFAWLDATRMLSRFRMFGMDRSKIRWVMHPSVIPDLGNLQVASGSAATWVQNLSSADVNNLPLLQYPIAFSEHAPQKGSGNVGNSSLVDFGAYGLWQRGEIQIGFSEHFAYNTGQITWRFNERYDGKPTIPTAVTLADPQGTFTQSAFVAHGG